MFTPGDAITFAWERIKTQPVEILLPPIVGVFAATVINIIISAVFNLVIGLGGLASGAVSRGHGVSVFSGFSPISFGLTGIGQIASMVISSFILAGVSIFMLKVARGAPFAFNDLLAGAPVFVSVLVAYFLIALASTIGFIFLVVPGIMIALGLSMTIPLIVDRGIGPIDALSASWNLTDGHKMNLFIFALISFGLGVAGICACGLGLFVVWPLVYLAQMYIYLKLTGQPVARVGRMG